MAASGGKEESGMTTYRTIQGDTWDNIAYKITGNINFMTVLMAANFDHVDTVIFSAGIVLQVPEIPIEQAQTLPPWRLEG
jgi:phage tail protein X